MVNGTAFEVVPPAPSWLNTVTVAVLAVANKSGVTYALMWVLSTIPDTGSLEPFHCTTAVEEKPLPVIKIFRPRPPAAAEFGLVLVIVCAKSWPLTKAKNNTSRDQEDDRIKNLSIP
jgi:hypothetical protein